MGTAHRRLSLMEQMSVMDNSRSSIAGLTLEALLFDSKPPSQQDHHRDSRTLLDIIQNEEPQNKEKNSWKSFRDKLRLKRAGAALTSSAHSPAHNRDSSLNRAENSGEHPGPSPGPSRPLFTRPRPSPVRTPVHHHDRADSNAPADAPPSRSLGFQFTRPNSTRFSGSDEEGGDPPPVRQLGAILAEERVLSAPEAASEVETAAVAAAEEEAEPARMSLMELLVETERGMAITGPSYAMDAIDVDDAVAEYAGEEEQGQEGRGIDHMCCVCMVRQKGSAFIPCGHTFCRLCSRELWVQRGNCPLCNGFIMEILDIF